MQKLEYFKAALRFVWQFIEVALQFVLIIMIVPLIIWYGHTIKNAPDDNKFNPFSIATEHSSVDAMTTNSYQLSDEIKLKIKQKTPRIIITEYFPTLSRKHKQNAEKTTEFIHLVNETMTKQGYIIFSSDITTIGNPSVNTIVTLIFERK